MADMEKCTLGIIGAGNILDSHLRALEQFPQIVVSAICDTTAERRERAAEQCGRELLVAESAGSPEWSVEP